MLTATGVSGFLEVRSTCSLLEEAVVASDWVKLTGKVRLMVVWKKKITQVEFNIKPVLIWEKKLKVSPGLMLFTI